MNRLGSVLVLVFLAFNMFAQNRQQAITENNQELLLIARKYSENNVSDTRASDLILKTTQIENSITEYMSKVSGGSFESMGAKQKIEYIESLSGNDHKIKEMNSVLKKSYQANHEYFSEESVEYNAVWESFKASLKSGVYGKAPRRKRKKN